MLFQYLISVKFLEPRLILAHPGSQDKFLAPGKFLGISCSNTASVPRYSWDNPGTRNFLGISWDSGFPRQPGFFQAKKSWLPGRFHPFCVPRSAWNIPVPIPRLVFSWEITGKFLGLFSIFPKIFPGNSQEIPWNFCTL